MFNGNVLRDAMISATNNLTNSKKAVDDLNVFPVPDGDTGTNMSMTLNNAASELKLLSDETAGKVAKVCASALLRGARGNSGVITSLLFRGFAKGLDGQEEITAQNLTNALKFGVEAAYKAVMKPTEGTILTVARVASEYAEEALKETDDVITVFEKAIEGAKIALADTPNLLPALKKANVVDAGGQGLVLIFEGMMSVMRDGVMIEGGAVAEAEAQEDTEDASFSAAGEFETEITFTYCTEFIVNRNPECTREPLELRAFLESIGDCVVVVDDEEIIKVHVHTDHPGKAIEEGITFGQLVHLKIENMRDQHERAKHDAEIKRKKAEKAKQEKTAPARAKAVEITKPVGFVSVCAGNGLADLFGELGVDTVVSGGQTMNPSTDDILNAIESTPAQTVYVLPNNKNIIMAAEQTVELSTRKVIVLPTRTVPQGVAAMLAYEESDDTEATAIAMQNAAEKIKTGQVTFAARDSDFDGHKIKKDQIMGMSGGKIEVVEDDLKLATMKLLKQMIDKSSEFVTVYCGEDVDSALAEELETEINEKFGNKVEVTFINGGQPVYYFIISVE